MNISVSVCHVFFPRWASTNEEHGVQEEDQREKVEEEVQ